MLSSNKYTANKDIYLSIECLFCGCRRSYNTQSGTQFASATKNIAPETLSKKKIFIDEYIWFNGYFAISTYEIGCVSLNISLNLTKVNVLKTRDDAYICDHCA